MNLKDREYLSEKAAKGDFISIAINQDESEFGGVFVPWEMTSSAYNMCIPSITLSVNDLQDQAVMDELLKCQVKGCYIFTPLEDYHFLAEFTHLNDLFIRYGDHLTDLSFVRNMKELFMLYLENAVLPDLEPLITTCNEAHHFSGKCFGFYHCKVEDTSALEKIRFMLSELLVWPIEGDKRSRWQSAAKWGRFRFYERKKKRKQ